MLCLIRLFNLFEGNNSKTATMIKKISIEHLGQRSLFTSHFIFGAKESERKNTKTETTEIKALHNWIDFKDNTKNTRTTDQTQSIDFLIIVDDFKEIVQELNKSYYNNYPYSTITDFLNNVFGYTIHVLERFLELELTFMGDIPNESNYLFYTATTNNGGHLDFAISNEFKIEHYKQYYKRVLEHLYSFKEIKQTQPPQQANKSAFSVLEWATIFYYADETKLLSENLTIKARIEQFINKYEINTTINYFRTQYYKAKNRINKKNDYPINKLELIIPFLKENYNKTVTKVENDIIFLKKNTTEY